MIFVEGRMLLPTVMLILLAVTQSFVLQGVFSRAASGQLSTFRERSKCGCAGQQRSGSMSMKADLSGDSASNNRTGFLLRQGWLAIGALGVVGASHAEPAAALFGLGQQDNVELEDVGPRMMIGKSQAVKWASVAPSIAALRTEARERFASTGATGGRELTVFRNETSEGADVMVGLEVADPEGSPALGNGFTASVIVPSGKYLRDDHPTEPGMLPWISFMTRMSKEGFEMKQPLSMFEVYSGTGGKEGVSMYAAISEKSK